MTTNDSDRKDSIARDLGWSSYDAAPHIVQNNIDSLLAGPLVDEPFAQFEQR